MSASRLAPRAPRAASSPCLALLAAVSAAIPPPSSAQTRLDPVTVTATREPLALPRVTADLVVIDAETIRASSADSIEDLLRREAGLQLTRNGGPGQNAGVFIRGASVSNTVVLIDGVRIGSATLGQAALEAISLAQIDHIEVLRGPGSSLYGADAVGGVVQVFTRRGDGALRFGAHAAAGGYSSRELDAGLSGSTPEGFDYAASLGHERSQGVSALLPGDQFGNYNPDRDGYRRSTGQLNLGFTPAAGQRVGFKLIETRLNAQYDGSEFGGAPDFVQDSTPDFRNHLDTRIAALDYRGQLTQTWTTTLQVSRDEDDLRSGATMLARYRTVREQATWQNGLKLSPRHELLFAYEHLLDQAHADGYAADVKRSNNAVVLGYSGSLGVHSLQADLRRDDNSAYGGNTTGRLGWSMELLPGLRLRALAGTTFRGPSFNDLYYPGYGIATIHPEHGRSIEAGLAWQAGDSRASATVYRNRVRDLIGFDPDPTGADCPPGYFGCAANIGRARLQGATLSAGRRWDGFSLRGTVDFLDAKDSATGERLVRRAAHQESISGDHVEGAWTFGAALLRVGARPDGGVQLGGYATLDLRAKWQFAPRWQFEAKLLNATDRRFEPARDYQGLGRQAWVGVRLEGQGI